MKKLEFKAHWDAFLHWKGWSAAASSLVKAFRAVVSWPGWKVFWWVPFPLLLILSVACAAGLIWVFLQGLETQIRAYFLYVLSFYCLIALCVQLPAAIRRYKDWLTKHPKIAELAKNKEYQFLLELYFEQFINFAYGLFKIISGIVIGSAWIGADGIYNFTQAIIQLFQILRRKKGGSLEKQWKSYRFCGWLILFMHLTLTGIVFQMVNWHRAEDHGQIMVIATAAFAFYKIISSFIDIARDRKHTHPVDSSVRMLELSQAIFAIFSLQASLLRTFGTGEGWEYWLNLATGSTACLMIASMGIYMIRRGNRAIKHLQEHQNGT